MARGPHPWLVTSIASLALGGCNQLFEIEETDVTTSVDTDSDGLPDLEDNCPGAPNPEQVDFDTDGVGDACDNCPLNANTAQQNVGEAEGNRDDIGDDCDPNPTKGGDCLILVDQFSDPDQLAANWELVHGVGNPTPMLQHAGDHVVFQPNAVNKPAFMLAAVNGERLFGRYSVNVVGDWNPPSNFAEAMAATDVTDLDHHLACGIQKISADASSTFVRFQVSATMSQVQAGFISGPPVRSDFSTRLVVERDTMDVARCSVKWGVADGATNTPNNLAPLAAGGAGIVATNDPVSIRAVALYTTYATCTPTVFR
jgi:hypothetical protein